MVVKMPIELTDQYLRIRVRHPNEFIPHTFRTHDFGRDGHSKRIAAMLKKNHAWATQSWLISRMDIQKKDAKTIKLLSSIKSQYNIKIPAEIMSRAKHGVY
jgi:hypothetical protein